MSRLLTSTDLSIAAAARPVGWTGPNYASRCRHARPRQLTHRIPATAPTKP